ncbi:MAG: hypothetical protein A2X64_08905 [Ignavibacteria bacterium GWF2_33_9]|nr:MAG: hypothetical protein A2X64_08905 [Ignavibacteria bacterium GWF2_33_9]
MISIDGRVFTLFAIDIGNSAIKLYSKGVYFHFSYKLEWQASLKQLLSSLDKQHTLFVISSVNPEKEADLQKIISLYSNFTILQVKTLIQNQKIVNTEKIQGIGNDRLLGLIGGLNYFDAPLITVDMGTATTVNYLDENKFAQGGAILPGVFTQFRSLIEHTSALKGIKLTNDIGTIGTNTNQAISSGIVNGMYGTVSYFINTIRTETKQNLPVILTGGNSNWISEKLLSTFQPIKQVPTLVLEGITFLTKTHFS